MEFRRILLSAVFVSLIAAQAIPAGWAGDGSRCIKTSSPASSKTMAWFPAMANGKYPIDALSANEDYEATFNGFTRGGNNDLQIAGWDKSVGAKPGICGGWGVQSSDGTYLGASSLAWTLWDLAGYTGAPLSAFVSITFPHETREFFTRLTIVSVTGAVSGFGQGDGYNSSICAVDKWTCEAFIKDTCQGYGTSEENVYTFVGGRRYIFIFDTPQETANTDIFKIKLTPRNPTKPVETFEGLSIASGSNRGALPTGWTSTSAQSQTRGWESFGTSSNRVNIPGRTNDQQSNYRIAGADSFLVGGLGQVAVATIPAWNPNSATDDCTGSNAAYCDHSADTLTTSDFAIPDDGTPSFELEFNTFYYDGTTNTNSQKASVASVLVGTNGTGVWVFQKVRTLKSMFNGSWVVETIPLPTNLTVGGTVIRFQFLFKSLDGKEGWGIDNVRLLPKKEYDMCSDGVACTDDKCAISYDAITGEVFQTGCYNPNGQICADKQASVDCFAYECVWNATAEGLTADSQGCVYVREPQNCNDGIPCTFDLCNEDGICINTPRKSYCDDGRGCTQDYCFGEEAANFDLADDEGCYSEPNCNDNVDCTIDTCEEGTIGGDMCMHQVDFNMCEDNIDCTYELICDPEQPGFDPVSGCIRIPMDEWCDDQNACTIDTCEPYMAALDAAHPEDHCRHEDMNCDDCIECTRDTCADGECYNEAINDNCDDDVPCTHDVCNVELGKCQNIPMDDWCYERENLNLCDVFTCRPYQDESDEFGCIAKTKECDDDLACTLDQCEEGECKTYPRDEMCDDGEGTCTDDYCVEELGKCVNLPNSDNCDDNTVCTINFCGRDGKCHFPEIDCHDDIWCTDDACDPINGCYHEANDDHCDDHFACTVDKCDNKLGGCTNIPDDQWCTNNMDLCHTWSCNTPSGDNETGCLGVPVDCNDGIPCTWDECDMLSGNCTHTPINDDCDDGHNCTKDYCDEFRGCVNLPINELCDDYNPCTIDVCGCDGECINTEIECDDQIACTYDYCDTNTGNCTFVILDNACNDGIECTADECNLDLGRCTNIEMNDWCNETSECVTGQCSIEHGQCVYKKHDWKCDDNIPCTDDVCQDGTLGCRYDAYNSLCDDGHDCTEDTCVKELGGCHFEPLSFRCNDHVNCTTDVCSTEIGCVFIPDHDEGACQDGIDCTADYCSEDKDCQNDPMDSWCNDGVACTVDVCDTSAWDTNFCTHTASNETCDDHWDCTVDWCDEVKGCQYDDSACPWHVTEDPLCLECTTSSAQILQVNYTDGTGAIQFATRSSASEEVKANLVALPTDQVIIGAASQLELHIGGNDGLVVNDNLRIVPLDSVADRPDCNEIRRGSLVVVPVSAPCGKDTLCYHDQIQVCSKLQEYEWVPLSRN